MHRIRYLIPALNKTQLQTPPAIAGALFKGCSMKIHKTPWGCFLLEETLLFQERGCQSPTCHGHVDVFWEESPAIAVRSLDRTQLMALPPHLSRRSTQKPVLCSDEELSSLLSDSFPWIASSDVTRQHQTLQVAGKTREATNASPHGLRHQHSLITNICF